jgi:hypothetical protein
VGTAVTGGLAVSAANDIQDRPYVGTSVPTDISDKKSQADTLAVVADVLGAATAIALGITLVATFSGGGAGAEPPKAAALRLGMGPGSAQLQGRF